MIHCVDYHTSSYKFMIINCLLELIDGWYLKDFFRQNMKSFHSEISQSVKLPCILYFIGDTYKSSRAIMMVSVGAYEAHFVQEGGFTALVLIEMIKRFPFKLAREEDVYLNLITLIYCTLWPQSVIRIFTVRKCVSKIHKASINEQFGDLHKCV